MTSPPRPSVPTSQSITGGGVIKGLVLDSAVQGLDVYIVGGAVRDAMLGLPAGDRDWVVVGATPEQMTHRGFIPVGGDFPVFLHPRSKEEYALARTERKSGRGYKGFTFYTGADVSLEDDLARRDLTINAIAQSPDGHLVDPLHGQADLQAKVLRHTGQAFAEDPVRLLRLARFAARFPEFSIADETMMLARQLVVDGEVDALVPERVWQEIAKGLATEQAGRMFQVLESAGALARVAAGLAFNQAIAGQLAGAARAGLGLSARFALLCHASDQPAQIGQSLRAPSECQDYARLLPMVLTGVESPSLQDQLDLIERCDALRKPARFLDLVAAANIVLGREDTDWVRRVDAVRSIDAGAIAKEAGGQPQRIKAALRQARLNALTQAG